MCVCVCVCVCVYIYIHIYIYICGFASNSVQGDGGMQSNQLLKYWASSKPTLVLLTLRHTSRPLGLYAGALLRGVAPPKPRRNSSGAEVPKHVNMQALATHGDDQPKTTAMLRNIPNRRAVSGVAVHLR